jgi:prepilin peptidase CpaA
MSWFVLFAVALSCIAAITDVRSRLIPNWLTFPALGIACGAHAFLGGPTALLFALLSALACFAPSYFLFVRGALGGGDVKLFAVLGALLGLRDGLEVQLSAFVLVAVFALATTAWHGRLFTLLAASLRATLHLVAPSRFPPPVPVGAHSEVPMGGAILLATLAVALRSGS